MYMKRTSVLVAIIAFGLTLAHGQGVPQDRISDTGQERVVGKSTSAQHLGEQEKIELLRIDPAERIKFFRKLYTTNDVKKKEEVVSRLEKYPDLLDQYLEFMKQYQRD